MAYQLVAADLDGTLRAEHKPFTPRVRAALKRAESRGVRVVMATGRMFRTAAPFAADLGLQTPLVCDHGATIHDVTTNEILYEKRVPLDLVREVCKVADGKLTLIACLDDEFYTQRATEDAVAFTGRFTQEHLHTVSNLGSFLTVAPQKLVFVNAQEITSRLFVDLTAHFGGRLQVVQSYVRYVELTHREASKGNAIAWLADRWQIRREQVIAIGDQHNDISMIQWAGLGVAMGNAVDSVKAAAGWVAPAAEEDGAAAVIERFVLDE